MTWSVIREQIKAEWAAKREVAHSRHCDHPRTRLVRYKTSNGVIVGRHQCLGCRWVTMSAVKKADIPNFNELPLVTIEENEAIKQKFYQSNRSNWQEATEGEQGALNRAFWALYERHMKSDLWARKRQRVIKRAAGFCEGCGDLLNDRVHIHHKTYDHLGDEFLFELLAICARCHQKIHPHRDIK